MQLGGIFLLGWRWLDNVRHDGIAVFNKMRQDYVYGEGECSSTMQK